LINQLPTRRFFRAVLEDSHFVVRCKLSALYSRSEGALFRQLLQILRFYENFEINDYTGQALTDEEMLKEHYESMQRLQAVAFKSFPELRKLALSNVAAIDSRQNLKALLRDLPEARLRELCVHLGLLAPANEGFAWEDSNSSETCEFMTEIVISAYERRLSQIESLNEKPLYPDEKLLWDETVVPSTSNYSGHESIALPKLNLQFLTFHDHLLRNYTLFRLESTFEIRQNVEDVLKRLQPRRNQAGTTSFRGWARMAQPLNLVSPTARDLGFRVVRVGRPRVGEDRPGEVIGEIRYTLPSAQSGYVIRQEWESIRSHDVVFLLSIDAAIPDSEKSAERKPGVSFPDHFGLKYVRGGEVIEMLDEADKPINENDPSAPRVGSRRTLRVRLDTAQFQADILAERASKGIDSSAAFDPTEIPSMYKTFNIVMRRKPKENNFKAVLETIRDLINARSIVVPDWLRDVFLGYGDPSACTNIEKAQVIDFVDTFLIADHLKASFPGKSIKFSSADPQPPFRLNFSDESQIVAESYVPNQRYTTDVPKKNSVPFTPTQVSAIQQAMNKGLTLVVGPPGTGKTDVAVQIISNWYHTYPNQRTLIVTHSNNALNQIFEKIMDLDIDERHLVRMGHGERTLETEKDFSRLGRVNHMLQLRLDMLQLVERLAGIVGQPVDVAYSCETAANFFHYIVIARYEKFLMEAKKFASAQNSEISVKDLFPFADFFSRDEVDEAFASARSYAEGVTAAEKLFREGIKQRVFDQLEECRPFELLKLQSDRGNYIVTKQARIVAMTCTHAALTRSQLVSLGFKFDNLLMEEAAQILEIETFIPMLLQEQSVEEESRLKRVVLIGDHNQLPPIVQNMVFQKFGKLDQSLFARLVKLGVPQVTLDAQGRARSGISALYSWRYKNLHNLPHVETSKDFQLANPGFKHDYQLIDVQDYLGVGEMEPNPHFYQNLGEAEYLVAVYMYMRILGYPKEKISVITSYNGQKHLLRDVFQRRCGWNREIGMPAKITTVDRFQGQQNDYILLSLVRTKTVGHIRDVRRLVVAMSRARLGLYVFCRKDLFKDCYELTPAFSQLLQRPDKLVLVQGEQYDDPSFNRSVKDSIPAEKCMEVADVAHMGMIASPANALGQFQQQQNEEAAPSDAVPESNDDAMDQDAPPAETAPSSSSDDDEE
jgi:intron-binding protein aquarius